MARTEIEARVNGEPVRVCITIGVFEAVAEIEPELATAMARVRLGHYRLVRAVLVEGARAGGHPKAAEWFDLAVVEVGMKDLTALAERALQHALFKQADAAGKEPAAVETGTETAAS